MKFFIFYTAVLASLLGFLVGSYHQHNLDLAHIDVAYQQHAWVGSSKGFIAGCELGVGTNTGDALSPVWTEFCVVNSMRWAKQTEPK